jgi:hypothetical protein
MTLPIIIFISVTSLVTLKTAIKNSRTLSTLISITKQWCQLLANSNILR